MDDKVKKPRHEPFGRPSKYSEELANLICQRVATHTVGLPALCEMFDDMPAAVTVNAWRFEKNDFSIRYAQAKMFQAELMAEEINDLCEVETFEDENGIKRVDNGRVALQRLKVDTRKWQAAKLAPKIYGDRQVIQTTVKHEENIQDLG